MSLRTSLLKTAAIVRGIASPVTLSGGAGLDVWINEVSIITRTWVTGIPGEYDPDDTTLTLTPNPEVRKLGGNEISSSGGMYHPNDVRVGHITPAYVGPPAGGYTPEQLAPVPDEGSTIIYRIAGPLAGDYRRVSLDTTDPFEYVLVLRRMNATPGYETTATE